MIHLFYEEQNNEAPSFTYGLLFTYSNILKDPIFLIEKKSRSYSLDALFSPKKITGFVLCPSPFIPAVNGMLAFGL